LRVLRGRVNQHPDFVFLVDEVGPVVVDERHAPTGVRGIHARRVGVARGPDLRRDLPDLLEVRGLADHAFTLDTHPKTAALLLREVRDVALVLFDKGGGDEDGHGCASTKMG
jgi:hypothetical protein